MLIKPDSQSHLPTQSHLTLTDSPDSYGGLDQSCDSNGGKNGSN